MSSTKPVRSLISILNQHVAVVILFFIILFLNVTHVARAQNMFFHLMGANALPPFVWTGNGGDTNWSTPGNWSSNVVPGVGDVAQFMGLAACNVSCAVTVDTDISVLGINMQSTFTGTITQATTKTMTIGASGWIQTAGTFVGSDANITVNNIFTLSGGTFTSTSTQLLVTSGFNYSAGTFNHNNGLLRFDNNGIVAADSTINVTLPGAVQLWNLQYSGGYAASSATYSVSLASGSFDVQNQFQIGLTAGGATGAIFAKNGTINLKGNLVVDPSIATPTLVLTTMTNLIIDGTGAQTYTATGGRIPKLVINKASGALAPTVGTTSMVAQSFTLTAGSFTAPPSTLTCLGDFTISNGATYTYNNGSLNFDSHSSMSPSYSITLPSALTVNNLSFGGGNSSSSVTTTWGLFGAVPTINVLGDLTIGNTRGGTGVVDVYYGEIFLTGHYYANAYSGSGTTTLTFNGSAAQGFTKTGAGLTMGGTITVDKSAGIMSLATAASFNTAGQDLSVTTGTMNMAGFNLTINDVLTVGVNGKLICNGGVLSAASYVINGEISCGPSAGITWTGLAGNNLWNDAGNWTNNTIPGASDIAVFNGVCSGANCNVMMNAAVSVKGVKILSSYTGTITQSAGIAVTVGTTGWSQVAGTFIGGNSTITMSGPYVLSGGAFTSTTANMNLSSSYTISGSPTFTHNSGTVRFIDNITIVPGTVDYYNVTFAGTQKSQSLSGGTMKVNGTLTLADTSACCAGGVNTGTILAYGNVDFSSYGKSGSALIKIIGAVNQTITGVSAASVPNLEIASTGGIVTISGTLTIHGNYTHTSGTVDTTTSTLIFVMNNTIVPGDIAYYNVTFGGTQKSQSLSGGTMKVYGTLTLADSSACCAGAINTGTILAYGNVGFSSYGKSGTVLIKIIGATNQTITGVSAASVPNLEIVSTGGIVTISGTLSIHGNYTHTSGTVDTTTSTLIFVMSNTIVPGGVAYYNVTFGGTQSSQNLSGGTMSVYGVLTVADTHVNSGTVNSGTILAYGDVNFSSNGKSGTVVIKISGTTNQTITGISTAYVPNLEIASTGGTVSLSGIVYMLGNYTHTFGAVAATTSTLHFVNSSTIVPGAVDYYNVNFGGSQKSQSLSGGTMKVNGLLTVADTHVNSGTINSGTIEAYGNVAFSSNGKRGSAVLNFVGSASTTMSAASTSARAMGTTIDINKTGGAIVTMTSDVTFNYTSQDLTITGGALDIAGFNLTVVDALTVGAGTTLSCSGGDFTSVSLTNNGTINCPGYGTYAFNWTGATADGNWNTAGNWQGGVAPSATSVVVFDDVYCGANCNATMNAAVNIKGIQMKSGYTNTITQGAGVTVNVGSKGWIQDNGIFVGSDATIMDTGPFTLNGGTFNSTSAALTIYKNFTVSGTPSFAHNSGEIVFASSVSDTISITPSTISLYKVTFAANRTTYTLTGTMTVNNLLTIKDADATGGSALLNSGTINAYGNLTSDTRGLAGTTLIRIVGSSSQSITGATTTARFPSIEIASAGGTVTYVGTLLFRRNYTYTSGSLDAGTSSISFFNNTLTTTIVPGNGVNYNDVTFAGYNSTFTLTGTMTVNGTLTLGDTNTGARAINTGTLLANGHVVFNNNGYGGTAALSFGGSGSHTLTVSGTPSVMTGAITVNKTSGGSVTLASSASFSGASQDLTITAGTLNMAGYALTIGRNISNSGTLQRGVSPGCGVLTYSGTYTGNAAVCP